MTHEELRKEIDAKCHANKVAWDEATKAAKAREVEIHALNEQLEALDGQAK